MKRSSFSQTEITFGLKQAEDGTQQAAAIAGEPVSGRWPALARRCWMTTSQVVQQPVTAQFSIPRSCHSFTWVGPPCP